MTREKGRRNQKSNRDRTSGDTIGLGRLTGSVVNKKTQNSGLTPQKTVLVDGLLTSYGPNTRRIPRKRRYGSQRLTSIFITFLLDQDTIGAPLRDYWIGSLFKKERFGASFNTRKFSVMGNGERDWVFGGYDQVTGSVDFFDGRDDSQTSVIAPVGIFTDFYFGYDKSASSATPVEIIDAADGNAIETGDPSNSSPLFLGDPCIVDFGTGGTFSYPTGGDYNKNPTVTTINGPNRIPDRLERIFPGFGIPDEVDPGDYGITAPVLDNSSRIFVETTTANGTVGVANFCPPLNQFGKQACSVQGDRIDQPITYPPYTRITTDSISWAMNGQTPVHGLDGASLTPDHGTVEASRTYVFNANRTVTNGEVNMGLVCTLTDDILTPLQWRADPGPTIVDYIKSEVRSYTDNVTRRTLYDYPLLPTASITVENSEIYNETFSSSVVDDNRNTPGVYNLSLNRITTTIRERIVPLFTAQDNSLCIFYRDRETIFEDKTESVINGELGYEISSYAFGNSFNSYDGFMQEFGIREQDWVKNTTIIKDRTIERQIFRIGAGGGEIELNSNNFDGLDRIGGSGIPDPPVDLPDLDVGAAIQMDTDTGNYPWKYWTKRTQTFARDEDNGQVGLDTNIVEKTELPYWSTMVGRQVILQQATGEPGKRWVSYATIDAIQFNDGNDDDTSEADQIRDIASMTLTITRVLGEQIRRDVPAVSSILWYMLDGVANNELPEEQDYIMLASDGGDPIATIFEECDTPSKSFAVTEWSSGEIVDINSDGSVRHQDERVEGGIFPITDIPDSFSPIVTFYHPPTEGA